MKESTKELVQASIHPFQVRALMKSTMEMVQGVCE
jgi:hypothetical protein